MIRTFLRRAGGVALLAWPALGAAAVSAERAAELDGADLTCIGAERAGTPSGVAAYTGQWLGAWPGVRDLEGYDPGPYADEAPQFTISAATLARHAGHLTEGQKALLQKYPASFRMPVYPSHRDFRYPDWVCDTVRANATRAELERDGMGARHLLGAIPFPFPASGLEALFNVKKAAGTWSESVLHSTAIVHGNGAITWGKVRLKVLVPWNRPDLKPRPWSHQEPIEAHFFHEQLLPERDRGTTSVGNSPNDYGKRPLLAWVWQPGTRRVRQAADVPPDFPAPPGGFHTVDDEALFNGSPGRFTWKLVGKREIYVPYHNFRINDPALRYPELLGADSIRPEYLRYELHRVWVIEGTLKPGLRHVYGRRVLYADEDTWHPLWADAYDTRGQLWRASAGNYFYAPAAQTFHRGVTIYHDLIAGAYEAEYLVNESGREWWRFNDPSLKPSMFSENALARRVR